MTKPTITKFFVGGLVAVFAGLFIAIVAVWAAFASGEFVIGAADTIGEEVAIAKEGLVTALVGQRPFEMGYLAPDVMIKLIKGEAVEDPVFTGLDECTKDTVDTCIQK